MQSLPWPRGYAARYGLNRLFGAVAMAVVAAPGMAVVAEDAEAQDLNPFEMSVIGNIGNIPQTIEVEGPGFTGMNARSGGKVDVSYRSFHELGLDGSELLRMVSRGDFDIGSLIAGYISGDAPFFMGLDVPGLAPSLDDARAQADAYREVLDDYMQEQLNVKVLAVFPSPLQILYCREPIQSLADLKGKRIRVHATVLATLVEQLGGIAVSIAYAEVYTSLQRGVVDCAATSSTGGNLASWFEVSNQIVTLPLGWAMSAFVANKDFWEGLEPPQQAFLQQELATMEQQLWDLAQERGQDGLSCNMGKTCVYGKSDGASMTLYQLTDADLASVRDIVAQSVLADWAEDCAAAYEPCIEEWNDTVGEVVGISIPQ